MKARHRIGVVARWLAGGVGLAVAACATSIGVTWYRYGEVKHLAAGADTDHLLD